MNQVLAVPGLAAGGEGERGSSQWEERWAGHCQCQWSSEQASHGPGGWSAVSYNLPAFVSWCTRKDVTPFSVVSIVM